MKVYKTQEGVRMSCSLRSGRDGTSEMVENVGADEPSRVVADKVGGFLKRVKAGYMYPGEEGKAVRAQISRLPDALSRAVVKLLEGY